MNYGTFKLEKDNTNCAHRFLVGPKRIERHIEFGHCDECRQEVAVQLDEKDKERTGMSWIVKTSVTA